MCVDHDLCNSNGVDEIKLAEQNVQNSVITEVTSIDNINFSHITYTSQFDLVPFKQYKRDYILGAIGIVIGIVILRSLFFIPILLFIAHMNRLIRRKKALIWQQFAQDNGWSFSTESALTTLPPSIADIGHSLEIRDIVSGKAFGDTFLLYEYKYVVGYGKHRQVYEFTVMEIDILNQFPHILLDSQRNNGGAARVRATSEKLSLEGDFDSFFSLYVEPSHRTDALSIISPDVMQTVMNATQQYDIEICGAKVYLFAPGDKRNKKYVRDLFMGMQHVLYELNHRALSFRLSQPLQPAGSMKPIRTFSFTGKDQKLTGVAFAAVAIIVASTIAMIVFIRAASQP